MTDLDSILDECLRQIEQGQASIEDCLARHPDHADALRLLIGEALELRDDEALDPDPRARSRMRARLGQHMRRHPRRRGSRLKGLLGGPALRWAAAIFIAFVLAVGSATWVAQAATPGTPLYPIKRASEAAWGRIVGQDKEYQIWLAERRLEEWIAVQSGDGETEPAREAYRRALSELEAKTDQELPAEISEELQDQRRRLEAAGLREPMLDDMLNGPPAATPTPPFGAEGQTPVPTGSVQPEIKATPTEDSILDELLPSPDETEILP